MMKLTLTPGQYLTLYDHMSTVTAGELFDLKNKMRSCMISALMKQEKQSSDELFAKWVSEQEAKIKELNRASSTSCMISYANSMSFDPRPTSEGFQGASDVMLKLENSELDEPIMPYPKKGSPKGHEHPRPRGRGKK